MHPQLGRSFVNVSAELIEALARAERAARDKRFGEADGICRDILRTTPNQPNALGIRGMLATAEGNFDLAIAMLEPAIAADPANPTWRTTLADVYRMVYRLDEALVLAREAAVAQPRQAGTLVNLGKVHYDRGELDDALLHFLAALACEPDNPNAHLGIGQILLAQGEFRPGWIEYEWRNKLEQAQGRYPDINAPLWNGMRLPRGRVLLIADQGFGDTIQFCRYIPLVAERCAEVIVGCAQDLRGILSTVPGIGRTFNGWRDIPGFSAYNLLSSLPFVFGTDGGSIPAAVPYLAPDPARVRQWRQWLDGACPPGRIRVGIFWSGRSSHPNNLRRSMLLSQFRPLAELPGIQLVSLQKEVSRSEEAALAAFPNTLNCSARLTDFSETAALIATLDLVVTIDSAVAHLAGAIGAPAWVMMPNPADWRWQLDRSDTPWYPGMRLFRQSAPGAWDGVVQDVVAALQHLPGTAAGLVASG